MGNIVWLDVLRSKLPEQMAVGVGARTSRQSHPFASAMQHEGRSEGERLLVLSFTSNNQVTEAGPVYL